MKITTKANNLVILLEGFERLWALKAFICIEVKDITAVVWNTELPRQDRGIGLRMPGTGLPTLFHAGSFWHQRNWDFYYIKDRDPGELIITTKLRKYHEIHLTTSEATAFEVREWFNVGLQTRTLA